MRSSDPGKSSVLKTSIVATFLALLILMAPVALHASTINYDYTLSLTQTSGTGVGNGSIGSGEYGGSGLVTITQATNPTAGNYGFTSDGKTITAMTFVLDTIPPVPSTYNLGDTTGNDTVTLGQAFSAFSSSTPSTGIITAMTFEGLNSADGGFALYMNFNGDGTYNVYDANFTTLVASGTWGVTAESTPAITPEPSSLILLGTGLLGGAGSLYRRYRLQRS
jgi:PEP-CTERM motif